MQHWLKKLAWMIPLMALAILFFGGVMMWLWNWLIPDIFNGPTITFWQAIGLLIMGRLLTGLGGKGGSWTHHEKKKHWKEKWSSRSEEEKRALHEKYKNRCRTGWKPNNPESDGQ